MEQITEKALLVMDMQSSILSNLPEAATFVEKVAKAIAKAREAQIPVIFVVVGFRQGMPEISKRNKGFSLARQRMASANMNEWMAIHPQVAPRPGEIVVIKRRVSAFTGSDLEVVLKGQAINHLFLTGVATSGVVLSTLREAADMDYQLTVISDCCADGDEEVQNVLMTKVFPRQADVIGLDQWNTNQ